MMKASPDIPTEPLPQSRSRGPQREDGSAYLVSLLALVVLAIVGLSMSLVTQTEMQIGANEGTINRVFYSTDSGVADSVARALTNRDYAARVFELDEPGGNPLLNLRTRIDSSPFYPILDSPCNLCEINNTGTYADRAYRKINHATTSTASRVAGPTDNSTPLGENTISAMVEVQPWRLSPPEALLAVDDPEELKRIKF